MRNVPRMICIGMLACLIVGCGAMATPTAPGTSMPEPAAPTLEEPMLVETHEPALPGTPVAATLSANEILAQLQDIDVLLHQQFKGSIAYNRPESMDLEQMLTIELLLNPSLSEEELGPQVSEPGTLTTSTIAITPRMKVVLLSPLPDAFTIQPIQEEIQLIGSSDTTKWSWFVTARRSGTHKLVLVVYRLVQYEGRDYWREVVTYRDDIEIQVPFARRLASIDWKWLLSIIVGLLSVPFIWGLLGRRRKKNDTAEKPPPVS